MDWFFAKEANHIQEEDIPLPPLYLIWENVMRYILPVAPLAPFIK